MSAVQWIRVDMVLRNCVQRVPETLVPTHDVHDKVIHMPQARFERYRADDWYCGRPIAELPMAVYS